MDNETDLTVPNDNLIIKDLDEEFISTYSSDTGEHTQRIITGMLMDRRPEIFDDDNEDLSVLDHEDTLDYLASERFFDCQGERIQAGGPRLQESAAMFGLCTTRGYQENLREDDAICT